MRTGKVVKIRRVIFPQHTRLAKAVYKAYRKEEIWLLELGEAYNKASIDKLFEVEKFDKVVNLAAQAGVRYSITNPYAYMQSNMVGFLNILEACRNFNVKHLIYASSSSVYGLNSKVPYSEDDKVDSPMSLYAASKKSNERQRVSQSRCSTTAT